MHSATIYFNILKFLITALAGRKFGFTDKFVQVKAEILIELEPSFIRQPIALNPVKNDSKK